MIRPLRTAHRIAFMASAIVLPLLLAAAVVSRKPVSAALPNRSMSTSGRQIGEFHFSLNGQRVSLSIYGLTGEPPDRYVLHAESGEASLPETLLYWTPSDGTDVVLTGANLIGSFRVDHPLTIPAKYASSGSLLLYDAPHQRILGQLPVGKR